MCIGCAPSGAEVVESARDECEAREGNTELRRNGPLYRCYEVTVEEDGWRLCYLSEPVILIRAVGDDEPDEGSRWGCGNTGPRYGDERQEPVPFPAVGTAPEGCKSAVAWFKDYLASVERALVEEQSNLASVTAGVTQVAVAYERLGRLLEQATPRADAVRDACHEDPDPDLGLGVSIGMYEIEELTEALCETAWSSSGSLDMAAQLLLIEADTTSEVAEAEWFHAESNRLEVFASDYGCDLLLYSDSFGQAREALLEIPR